MVTFNVTLPNMYNEKNAPYVEGSCLSSDAKPTNVANGSKLLEMDTSTLYIFDDTNSTWRAW